MRYYTSITLSFFIFSIIGFIVMIYMHERAHQEIFSAYNIDSRIDYFKDFPFSVVTIAEEPCPTELCTLSHSINEIIWYPLSGFYILLFVYFLSKLLIKIYEDDNRN